MKLINLLIKKDPFTQEEIEDINSFLNIPNIEYKSMSYIKEILSNKLDLILKEPKQSKKKLNYFSSWKHLATCTNCDNFTIDDQLPNIKTINVNSIKAAIAYCMLNKIQKEVFSEIHLTLSSSLDVDSDLQIKSPKIMLLDSPPGTGKSFLLSALAMTLKWTGVECIVYQRNLCQKLEIPIYLKCSTICSFILKLLDIDYDSYIKGPLNQKIETRDQYKILKDFNEIIKKKSKQLQLLIIDEMSVINPMVVAILIMYGLNGTNLLFVGDKIQHDPITNSYIKKNGNHLLISDFTKHILKLDYQMRITDTFYLAVIDEIRNEFLKHDENIPHNYNFMYFLYKKFPDKFTSYNSLESNIIYIARLHQQLKDRIKKVVEYNNGKWELYQQQNNESNAILDLPKDYKFINKLPLILNYLYIDVDNNILRLKEIKDDCLICIDVSTKETVYIYKKIWTDKNKPCTIENFKWLEKYLIDCSYKVYQYPIKLYTITFHNIQGLTIASNDITINCNNVDMINSIYVALSRIPTANQLIHIEYDKTFSLIYTAYRNDNYFYKCVFSKHNKHQLLVWSKDNTTQIKINEITFIEVNKFSVFEKINNKNIKIQKRIYLEQYKKTIPLKRKHNLTDTLTQVIHSNKRKAIDDLNIKNNKYLK